MKDGLHEILNLCLYGPFRADVAGTSLRISSRRGQALLAMLACCPDNCLSRAKAQLALWEDRSEAQARTSLRQELANLRKVLSPLGDVLETSGDLIRIDPGRINVAPPQPGAVFLEGLDLPSDTFEDWLREQRAAAPPSAAPVSELFESPAVLLLPFTALSASDEDSLLARGLGEDIRTSLACYRWFPVIGHEALGEIASGPAITELCARVGASFAVKGTVRRAGMRARVTAQLIDGTRGQQLWSQTFDGELEDVFDFQEQVAARVVAQIEPEILHAADAKIDTVRPRRLDTWELLIMADEVQAKGGEGYGTASANAAQRKILEDVLARDPGVAEAWAKLARCHFREMLLGWSEDRSESLALAMEASERAIGLNPNDWLARTVRAVTLIFGATDPLAARAHAEAAVRLNPSSPLAHQAYACVMEFLGHTDEAIEHFEAVFRLNPNWGNAAAVHGDLMICYGFLGDLDTAVAHARKMLAIAPGYMRGLQRAAAVFGHAGLLSDAQAALDALAAIDMRFDETYLRETYPFFRARDMDFLTEGLRKAGWQG